MMEGALRGQVAIVTGAATGIGEGVIRELAARGAMVGLNHFHQPDLADAIVKDIRSNGGKAIALDGDVSHADNVEAMVKETVNAFGRLDIMVSNAGIQVDSPAKTMTPEQWDAALNVDLKGSFLCAQAAARVFCKQGVNPDISRAAGKIVCMLSVHDTIPWMGHVNYASAKAGAKMMMMTLAQEFAADRIRVVGVSPGAIATDINRNVWENEESHKKLMKIIPYQRMGEVADVGRVVAWLASDEADYITGSTIYVDGGMMLYPGFMDNG